MGNIPARRWRMSRIATMEADAGYLPTYRPERSRKRDTSAVTGRIRGGGGALGENALPAAPEISEN